MQLPTGCSNHLPPRIGQSDPGVGRLPALKFVHGLADRLQIDGVAAGDHVRHQLHLALAVVDVLVELVGDLVGHGIQVIAGRSAQARLQMPLHEHRQRQAQHDARNSHHRRKAGPHTTER